MSNYKHNTGASAGTALGFYIVVFMSALGFSIAGPLLAGLALLITWVLLRVIVTRIVLPLFEDLTDIYHWIIRR